MYIFTEHSETESYESFEAKENVSRMAKNFSQFTQKVKVQMYLLTKCEHFPLLVYTSSVNCGTTFQLLYVLYVKIIIGDASVMYP